MIEEKVNLRDLQLFEITILDAVVDVCKQYKIQYYLSDGTLLGAIRHGGFIPWDDDIDIEMPIKDYKKFCKVAPCELNKKGFFLQTYKNSSGYQHQWAKVHANNTTWMPTNEQKLDVHWGVYIDIFPLIGLYDNSILKRIQCFLFDLNRMILEKEYYDLFLKEQYKPSIKIKILYALPRAFRCGLVSINNVIVDRDFWKSTKGACKFVRMETRNKQHYGKGRELQFEGKPYNSPFDYDGRLTELYGDYMTPPPINERNGHELGLGDIITDLQKDYKEYQKELDRNDEK